SRHMPKSNRAAVDPVVARDGVAGAYSLEEAASVRSRSRQSRRRVGPSLPVARQARIVSAAPRRNGHGRADRGGGRVVVPRQVRAGTLAGALGGATMPRPPRTTGSTSLARRIGG